uniref:Uncharacterized protein n=1 Tax=Anguilla anguilla TaxID=7936 RepID=A0A0E9T778_ANGAN
MTSNRCSITVTQSLSQNAFWVKLLMNTT